MSNRPIGEVPIGWRKESNALGLDNDCEFALSRCSTFVLMGVENYIDVKTGAFLHF